MMTFNPKAYSRKANNFSVDLTTGSHPDKFTSIIDSRSNQSQHGATLALQRWRKVKPQKSTVKVNLSNFELQMFSLQKKFNKLYTANVFILNKVSKNKFLNPYCRVP